MAAEDLGGQMPSLFDEEEFGSRLERVRNAMIAEDIEVLVVSDPCNIYYLTGYDGWSFYTPQVLLVGLEREPVWIGRNMDALGVRMLSWLSGDSILGYPENLVQSASSSPFDFIAERIVDAFGPARRIGVEKQSYYLTVQSFEILRRTLSDAALRDASLLVNWIRFVKSPTELRMLREAAQLLDLSMTAAIESAGPGVRECDVAAAIYAANCRGTSSFGGVYTSSPAFIASAERTAAPHLCWSDRRIEAGTSMNLELMGNRQRYQVTMARTVYFGNEAPRELKNLEGIVVEAIHEVLDFVRPGVTCEEVENVWRTSIARYGLAKESRCGYSLGIAYPPTGGELTASFRPGDRTELQSGVAMHFLPAIWSERQSLTISEPLVVTANGCERLSRMPTRLIVKEEAEGGGMDYVSG